MSVRRNEVVLEQAIVNLVRNGIESRPEGVGVEVRTYRCGASVGVEIRDDGPGLDEKERERVFEPFHTTKLRKGGSGLGLSVVHGIVTQYGGEIAVDDAPGCGARFRVTFARAADEAVG